MFDTNIYEAFLFIYPSGYKKRMESVARLTFTLSILSILIHSRVTVQWDLFKKLYRTILRKSCIFTSSEFQKLSDDKTIIL